MDMYRNLIMASALALGGCASSCEDKYGSQAEATSRNNHEEVPGVPHLMSDSVPSDREFVAVICGKPLNSRRITTFDWMKNKEKSVMSFYHVLPSEPMAQRLGLSEGQTMIYRNGKKTCLSSSTFVDQLIVETGYHSGDTATPPHGCQDSLGPGKKAPDFEYRAVNTSEKVSLKGLEGKVIILDFWATWCGPCLKVQPHLERLADMYPEVKIIGISVDENPGKLQQYLSERKINYTIVNDSLWDQSPTVKAYQVIGIPDVFLIDQKGVVRGRDLHVDFEKGEINTQKLEMKVRELLDRK